MVSVFDLSFMPYGKVKFINSKNKFGFITENESGKDIYVHIKDLTDEVTEGDEVEFVMAERKRGPVALAVRKKS
ncbi:MAG: cold shock domain-containing protein [Bacteroidota bacterium]|nr:cold shock domain-containing protein [Bacteroidota bacterium]